mmetsp:Transcript_24691/g.48036  ORF Transcript_24691/g.48036 Transcript_24691/m.48036 type:complete len:289 (+) Transcript_24691:52-918(+)
MPVIRSAIYALGKCTIIASLALPSAEAFAPGASPTIARSAAASAAARGAATCSATASGGDNVGRRELLLGLVALPLAAPLSASALKYDPNDAEAKQAYLDERADDRKARYGRQPTRTDTERNIKKIIAVKATLDACAAAIKDGDAKGVAEAIGDLTIEPTKKNANLGKDIPLINKARPYMFTYASLFSKGKESPLTVDLKAAATDFFAAMEKARNAGLKDDLAGATAAIKDANKAMRAYADAIEAETLDGRINSIKVTVMGVFDESVGAAVEVRKANAENEKSLKPLK